MAAGLLVRHGATPHRHRVEVLTGRIAQVRGVGGEQAGHEALDQQRAVAIAAVRVEPDPDDAPAVAHRVGRHRDQADRHGVVADRRVGADDPQRHGPLPDPDDAHAHGPF